MSLIGVFAAAGLNAYIRHKQSADLQITASRIASVFGALDAFYEHHCASGSPPAVSSADLLLTDLITVDGLSSPWGDALVPSIDWSVSPVMLSISMTVDMSRVTLIENNLHPTSTVGPQLVWLKTPSMVADYSEAKAFKGMYETGCG